jgi:hypothetical protein
MGVPLAVAETAFASALVELNVVVKTPLVLVAPEADGVKLLAVPVDDTVTDDPLITLPNPSLTVTVMIEAAVGDVQAVLHAVSDAVLAVSVDVLAFTGPGVPVALKVAPGVPLELAVTVLLPAVMPSVHEVSCANPLPSVTSVAGVGGEMVPPPEASVNVTLAPAIALPARSVTWACGAVATAVFTVALWPSPALLKNWAGLPCRIVAVNVCGEPVSPPTEACALAGPATVPRTRVADA